MKIKGINFNSSNFLQSIKKTNHNNKSENVLGKEAIRIKISEIGNKFYDYQNSENNPKIFDDMK